MAGEQVKMEILVKLRDEASAQMGKLTGGIKSHSAQLRKASLATGIFGGVIVGVLGMSVKAAAAEQASIQRLRTTYQAMGLDYEAVAEDLEKLLGVQQRATAFTDTEQRDALADLVRMMGSQDKALSMLNVSMDIARGTNKELGGAVTLVSYALSGNFGMLTRVLPSLKAYADALQKDKTGLTTEEKAMRLLTEAQRIFANQAADYGKSAEGRAKAMGMAFGDLKEKIGDVLLPTLAKFAVAMTGLLEGLQNINPEVLKWGVLIAGIVGGLLLIASPILMLITMLPFMAAGFAMVSAAMLPLLGPVGIIMGLIALAALLAVAWTKNWGGIQEKTKAVLDFIVGAAKFAGQAILTYLLLPWRGVLEILQKVVSAATSIPGLGEHLGGLDKGIGSALGAMKGVMLFQRGGIVTRPTLGLLGESGPEAVVPLGRGGLGNITITGNNINVRDDQDIDRIAKALMHQVRLQGAGRWI